MNRDNLSKVGIVNVPNEDYVFVDSSHPIVEMLQVNAAVLQVDMSEAKLIDGRWYKVASQVVADCTKLLDQQLLQVRAPASHNRAELTQHRAAFAHCRPLQFQRLRRAPW
jgi:hypothetical protein